MQKTKTKTVQKTKNTRSSNYWQDTVQKTNKYFQPMTSKKWVDIGLLNRQSFKTKNRILQGTWGVNFPINRKNDPVLCLKKFFNNKLLPFKEVLDFLAFLEKNEWLQVTKSRTRSRVKLDWQQKFLKKRPVRESERLDFLKRST